MKCEHSGLEAEDGLPCKRQILRSQLAGGTAVCDWCTVCAHVVNSFEPADKQQVAADETTEA